MITTIDSGDVVFEEELTGEELRAHGTSGHAFPYNVNQQAQAKGLLPDP